MTTQQMHYAVGTNTDGCMPILTIRNVPEDVYAQLRARAQATHRSMNSEAIECLRFALARRAQRDVSALIERARALHERMPGPYLTNAEIARARRQGRE